MFRAPVRIGLSLCNRNVCRSNSSRVGGKCCDSSPCRKQGLASRRCGRKGWAPRRSPIDSTSMAWSRRPVGAAGIRRRSIGSWIGMRGRPRCASTAGPAGEGTRHDRDSGMVHRRGAGRDRGRGIAATDRALMPRAGSPTVRGYGADWQRIRAVVLARDEHRCHWCGRDANTVDHLKPLAMGGERLDPANLVAACRRCNSRRGAVVSNRRRSSLAPGSGWLA
jgi:HNH endonuclease